MDRISRSTLIPVDNIKELEDYAKKITRRKAKGRVDSHFEYAIHDTEVLIEEPFTIWGARDRWGAYPDARTINVKTPYKWFTVDAEIPKMNGYSFVGSYFTEVDKEGKDIYFFRSLPDVEVPEKVSIRKLEGKRFSNYSLRLEHDIRSIVSKQEDNGFYIDQQKASGLHAMLEDKAEQLEKEVHKTFPPLKIEEEFIPKVNNKSRGYVKGVPFTKVSYQEFNLASRKQIAERLMKLGWKPNKFTDKGSPIVDESVLSKIDNIAEAKLIAEYLLLKKRTSQISSWLDVVNQTTGRVHGRVLTLRCVSGRMSHHSPNMAQIPATYSPYGKECREVWTTDKPDTHVIFGTDASGLELRMLAHYINTPEYTHEILNGDIHTKNMNMAGLSDRDQAKTFIYAFLFGAGAKRIAQIIGSKDMAVGKKLIDKFLSELPRLKSFRSQVEEAAQSGKVKGLDGRLFNVRSAHKAVNTIIQGAGAIACKVWLRNMIKHVRTKGLDVKLVASIHDEYQFEVNKNDIQSMGEIVKLAIKETTEQLNLNCPLDAEYKTGLSWAETH